MSNNMLSEVLDGLNQNPKQISSKYHYDTEGSRLFEKITAMPSYYLYNAEYEILKVHGREILDALPFTRPFSIVEFGAGDGSKTIELLKQLHVDSHFNRYIPVDISAGANGSLTSKINSVLPELPVTPVKGNYMKNMASLIPQDEPVLLLYLGSNIGNFKKTKIQELVLDFGGSLKKGDALLTGFDLRKNPLKLRQAYDDPEGITRAFNMNLLDRFNRELGSDFDLGQFDFYSYYHPGSGEVRSFLISLVDQQVHFNGAGQTISFTKDELIHTEVSKKFSFNEIHDLLDAGVFRKLDHWQDSNGYYADVLAVRS